MFTRWAAVLMPALFTRMSSAPNLSTISAMTASTSASSVTSMCKAIAPGVAKAYWRAASMSMSE